MYFSTGVKYLHIEEGGDMNDLFDHTNHWNKGLISADRRTKPTLMLTIPRSEQSRLQWIYLFQRLKLR